MEHAPLKRGADPQRLPVSTYLLSLAQAINLTAAVLSVSMSALVGARLAPSAAWATLPYGLQFAVVMLSSYPAAMVMRRWGRKPGFMLGAVLLAAAGGVGYTAVREGSYLGLAIAHALLGGYIAFANFYRFAAVDGLQTRNRARALSWVVAGGVLAALVAPWLATELRVVEGFVEFSLAYASLAVLGFLTLGLLQFWHPPESPSYSRAPPGAISPAVRVVMPGTQPHPWMLWAGMLAAGVGYFVMNLLMVQSSLVLRPLCGFDATSRAIQWHVLAMFVPSFFTGHLIGRWGTRLVLVAGFALLALAAGVGALGALDYLAVSVSLLLLGLGWNFSYVAGGAVLAEFVPEHERHRWQGINDALIAATATLGAFLPAPALQWMGWHGTTQAALLLCLAMGGVCAAAMPSHRWVRAWRQANAGA